MPSSSQFSIPDDVLAGLARAQRVSEGELAALKLALGQKKSKDIAKHLGISEAAARKRLGEVYRKFGIKGKGPGKLASLERWLMAAVEDRGAGGAGNTSGDRTLQVAQSLSSPALAAQLHRYEGSAGALPARFRDRLPTCPNFATRYHWNDAPALNLFQGRREPIAALKQWILSPTDAHKLLAICGIGGIGKTSLTRKLVEELDGYFEQVVWLTARKMQTPSELLKVLLELLSLELLPVPTSFGGSKDEGMLSITKALPAEVLSAEISSKIDRASQKTVQWLIERVIACFSQRSCLVVIDGFETVFKSYSDARETTPDISEKSEKITDTKITDTKSASGKTPTFHASRQQQASLYRDELTAYSDWFEALRQPLAVNTIAGESVDKSVGKTAELSQPKKVVTGSEADKVAGRTSCLILTSREKPKELLAIPEGEPLSRLYTLNGLQDHEAARMLAQFRLRGKATDYKELVDRYYGHPMALRLAANAVKDLFYGRIRDFLDQEISVFDDLRSVLKTQFRRLSPSEIEVMYWLAINHAACTLEDLQADVVSQDLKENLLYILQSLERRFLVDVMHTGGVSFRLHPIVEEYVLNRFIREVFQDLIHGNLSLFNSHALMKADAEDSCREFQKQAIVLPVLERLRNYFKSLFQVDKYLNSRLDDFRENNAYRLGYAGGNFVNLMVELSQGKLSRKDFSELTIWQAYLQGAQLRDVNFTRCELNRSVFTETVSDVMSVAFNDGEMSPLVSAVLACGDTRGVVHMWFTAADYAGAGQKCAEWSGHNGWVRAIEFCHRRACVLTGGDDGLLKLWQLPAFGQQPMNQPRLLWQRDTGNWVYAIALSPDESITAVGGENKITLYDSDSGQPLCQWLHDPSVQEPSLQASNVDSASYQASVLTRQSAVRSLTFSPDGQQLASCGDDDIIRLWSLESVPKSTTTSASSSQDSVSLVAELKGHTDWVRTVKFSADGAQLLSSSDDGTVRIWPVGKDASGREFGLGTNDGSGMKTVLRQSSDGVALLREDRTRTIAISPDGRLLASGGDDCYVRLWDLATQQLVETVSTHRSRIWSVAFQQQGNKLMLAAGGDKQTLMLWQVHVSDCPPENAISQASILEATAQSAADISDTSSTSGTAKRRRGRSELSEDQTTDAAVSVKARAVRTYRGYTNGIRAVSFLGERHIVSAGDNRDLAVWSRADGERKATFSRHQGRIWAIAVDTQNARIASASDDHTICLWDANTGQCLTTFAEHTSWVRTVAFSQRGRFLASSGDDCTIRIWNTASGFCLKGLEYSPHWIHSVCFDPTSSRYLVSGGDDKVVRCWDRKEGLSRSLAVHDHRICSVAYSPDGALVASGSDDNTVILWDMASGEMSHHFTQPELGIKTVTFSPDGRYLAAGGEDQMVYLWDLHTPEKACLKLRFQSYSGLAGGIRSVAFSPDGRSIISGGLDETIRICDLSELIQLRENGSPSAHRLPVFMSLIQPERPYENIEIEGVKGLSHLQFSNLLSLGAVNRKDSLFL